MDGHATWGNRDQSPATHYAYAGLSEFHDTIWLERVGVSASDGFTSDRSLCAVYLYAARDGRVAHRRGPMFRRSPVSRPGPGVVHAFRILYGTGLRVGEALQLQHGDVQTETGILQIRNAKGRKDRRVPLHPALADRLMGYLTLQPHATPTTPCFPIARESPIQHSQYMDTFGDSWRKRVSRTVDAEQGHGSMISVTPIRSIACSNGSPTESI